jgi:hypothetical protein
MIHAIQIGSKGCGKTKEMMERLHMTPDEYEASIQQTVLWLKEAEKRRERQKELSAMLWRLYYRDSELFF